MYAKCLEILEAAATSCSTAALMGIFRSKRVRAGEKQGPRIWNGQLLRFAGYKGAGPGGTILGDPVDADFTSFVMQKMGWQPPNPPTANDILPLVLQARNVS
jgi:nitric oxide synthase oxygenase domain/subunit